MPALPKTAAEKILAGNPGKRPIPAPFALLEGHAEIPPAAPNDLGPVGLEAWERVWPVLVKWARPDLDRGLVRRYCQALDERELLREDIRKHRWVRGSQGQKRLNPAFEKLGLLEDRLMKMEHELGLSPAGRRALHIEKAPDKPVKKLDRYLA